MRLLVAHPIRYSHEVAHEVATWRETGGIIGAVDLLIASVTLFWVRS